MTRTYKNFQVQELPGFQSWRPLAARLAALPGTRAENREVTSTRPARGIAPGRSL